MRSDEPTQHHLPPDNLLGSPSKPPSGPKMAASSTAVAALEPPRLSPRSVSDCSPTTAGMTASSTPLGSLATARKPASFARGGSNLTSDIQARMKAFHMGRQGTPPGSARPPPPSRDASSPAIPNGPVGAGFAPGAPAGVTSPTGSLAGLGGVPAGFKLPSGKPMISNIHSAPAVPSLRMASKKPSLAEKRGMALPGGLPGQQPNGTPPTARKRPNLSLSQMNGSSNSDTEQRDETKPTGGTMMDKYADYLDPKTGTLQFKGKAVLTSQGVEFSSGSSFSISLDEVDTLDELGKGNYGTVFKVRHSRPKIRKPGLGLAGNKFTAANAAPSSPTSKASDDESSPQSAKGGTTGIVMAMKEIRLELDDAKFAAIIMELDILHRCLSPYIIDFYGAFFQEGAVYICMEFMDGGSIDKLYGGGIPENVLRKITLATTIGLKTLKEDHNIIHRDVKPTNILMNTRGQIKICDFGVSGNLVASIAKTNIGCQSYMAPERISTGGIGMAGANPGGGTYSVQSDIWSLGLTIIECAMGRYPYPPETYSNIFSQLSAIVDGEPPDLPEEGFSAEARDFVRGCLHKIPKLRPTYPMLLQHPWLSTLSKPAVIMEEDEEDGSDATPASDNVSSESDNDSFSGGDSPNASTVRLRLPSNVVDQEVAEWVLQAVEKRKLGKLGKTEKPALHAAPLDAVASPAAERKGDPHVVQLPTVSTTDAS